MQNPDLLTPPSISCFLYLIFLIFPLMNKLYTVIRSFHSSYEK